ncbi:MAG TPA: Mut7-C RNAse domain-containing protein [Vicinamibacteria bacterium]|nr:Mut7-C RNAse domain-containing protein [Vicinamibacteria bacterium]
MGTTAAGPAAPRFTCDGGLGGLARWLRAAGYEAESRPGTSGDSLVPLVRGTGYVLLTCDRRVFLRREVREGRLPAVLVPSSLTRMEQLAHIMGTLGLTLREPRCMACGGPLEAADKDAVRERIPPRTARWLDEYFVCRQCGRLFWRGTHWRRIREGLDAAAGV